MPLKSSPPKPRKKKAATAASEKVMAVPVAPEQADPVEPELDPSEILAHAKERALPPLAEEHEREAPVPAESRSIVPSDPLSRYMAEVSRHRLLTREEETTLAVRLRETGDVSAAYALVTANLRLVVKIAHEYRRAAFSVLDLIQEGNIGLMQAVKKFDPYRGVKLSSYAAWWIRAYIIRYIMDNFRMVKLGTTEAQRKLFFNLRKEREKLVAAGFEPTPALLAERLDVSENDVQEMDQRLGNEETSLDAPLSRDGTATAADRLSLPTRGADDRLAAQELKQVFAEKLQVFGKTLKDKERFIFEKRLASDNPITLQEIGDTFGTSRERARQLEARLIDKLRDFLRQEIPDFDELQLTFEQSDE